MIPRYTRPEMAAIWSDQNKYKIWYLIEAHATEKLATAPTAMSTEKGHKDGQMQLKEFVAGMPQDWREKILAKLASGDFQFSSEQWMRVMITTNASASLAA